MTALAAGLALLAAALFAVAAAVQQRSAAEVRDEQARGLRLVLALARRPLWWAGAVSDTGGYVAQAAALGAGSLVLVQPLLVTTLLFALPLGAAWAGRRLRPRDWLCALLLAAALAVFVVAGQPSAGTDRAGLRDWLPTAVVLAVVLVGCLAGAATLRGTPRALLLAVATGIAYGVGAALTKGVVSTLHAGPVAVLTSWETYVLAAAMVGGTLLQQSAFQAGDLAASLPAITVGEPVVAVVIGTVVLHERLRADGAEWVLLAAVVVAMVVATGVLARSAAGPAAPAGEPATAGRRG
ncbi:DMT family transporter [Modestobacter sp. NPDC049651]|uniref:DMT family transporter n=1 Tax=unclassified Modestobacter TaxID=2643866 RepID=UPI0033C4F494